MTWRQTHDELEVVIDLPEGVKARDISLTMKHNLIKFGLKNGHVMPEEDNKGSQTLLQLLLSGMKLFSSIDTDLSTWTASDGQLVISLTKKDPVEWFSLSDYLLNEQGGDK